ncbi:MAG: hypothetical protein AAFP90_04850 [Planctomycetota bacterium]
MREEEMERELKRLESRLKKMTAMQSELNDKTVLLSGTPKPERGRQTDSQSGELSFSQRKIVLEADRALLLLREEGSSVAFPEVLSEIRGDMQICVARLSNTKIDAITQGIQSDILEALEDMVAAVKKARRDLEKKKQQEQQQQQSQQGQQGDQPLVDALAELRMIKSMESRIKKTTGRYSAMLQEGEIDADADFASLLQTLSTRQDRLYKITRDLVMRRNK